MSGWDFKGYGRAWTEDKASGLARFFQIMREPASKNTYYVLGGVFLFVIATIEIGVWALVWPWIGL